ncbi:hypothetical protein EDC04DRAFT_3146515 [Pisolithus marmoratus]|nr:hypothetical protein EDC04DRAFT_3146515 [Pisolithus marmoratus]
MALPLELSYIELQNTKDVASIDLELNGLKYHITQSQDKSDTFSKQFDKPLTLATEPLSLSVGRKRLWFCCYGQTEIITIRSDDVRRKLNRQEFLHVWDNVSIKLVFLSQTQPGVTAPSVGTPARRNPEAPQSTTELPVITHPTSAGDITPSTDTAVPASIPAPADTLEPTNTFSLTNSATLQPTTDDLVRLCPRFRVLVVGKSGVGKSTLINRIFGVESANVATDRPGEADIEKEFTSPQNDRLILHDSKGFEPGDSGNYETVESFIEKRKRMPDIKDQLHAVWLCFQIPIPNHGERLLEDAAEAFLKIREEVLGNSEQSVVVSSPVDQLLSAPTIIVFTKYDRLVTAMRQRKPANPATEEQYLQEYCIQPIQDFTGGKVAAHVAVSSKPKYEQSLRDLITRTQDMVSMSFTSANNQVSVVPLAAAGAQRMLSKLKVDLSIDVGKQKYWSALGTSVNFPGHTIQDCLGVIHTDIVSVWNFYDPYNVNIYLKCEEFRVLMLHMVERVNAQAESSSHVSRSNSDPYSGGLPLIALAPVILPLNAFFSLGKWVYEIYQRLQGVPTKFMAHIVDLTHVLEILFSLTASMRAKPLTRMAIKLAYKAYLESQWIMFTHADIRSFQCWTTARDVVLEKITSMITSDDRDVQVSRALEGMPSVDLERDEEWVS